MRRRKVLKTLIVGGAAAAMIHPTSRKKVIKFGKMSVDVYKRTCISLSEKKKVSPKNMAELRPFFNFSSKKEEQEFEREILKNLQSRREKEKTFLPYKIVGEEMQKQILVLTKRRRVFASEYLKNASFEGKNYTRAEVGRALIRYFELNKKDRRVPSEIEIRDMIDNGVEYR